MNYIVKAKDSLIKIATVILGDKNLWRELALKNHINPPYKIYIGQELRLPAIKNLQSAKRTIFTSSNMMGADSETNMVNARAFFFVLADEILPSEKIVRKVLQYPSSMQEMILAHPEKFGMHAPMPKAKISIGEHALGANKSPYLSGSTLPKGAPNITGRPVYIDINKVKKAGVIIY